MTDWTSSFFLQASGEGSIVRPKCPYESHWALGHLLLVQ